MSDFDDRTNKPEEKDTCPAYVYQEASVCVPVEVVPFAKPGVVKTFCKGDPIISCGCVECPGIVNNKCHFTITQKVCVKVPVEVGAHTLVGNPHIQCEKASGEDCRYCGKTE
jgi:hypothetical protein